MCPACIANMALTAAGVVATTGGLTALIATKVKLRRAARKAAPETTEKGKAS